MQVKEYVFPVGYYTVKDVICFVSASSNSVERRMGECPIFVISNDQEKGVVLYNFFRKMMKFFGECFLVDRRLRSQWLCVSENAVEHIVTSLEKMGSNKPVLVARFGKVIFMGLVLLSLSLSV